MAIAPDVTFNIKPRKPHVTAIWILSIVLLLSLGGNVCQHLHIQNKELADELRNINHLNENAVSEDRIKQAQARIDSITAKGIRDSVSWKSRESALKMRNSTTTKNLAVLRVPVQPLIDSIKALGDFVLTYDSLSAIKDSTIYETGMRLATKEAELHELGQLHKVQITEQVGITNNLQEDIVFEQGETRKWKRKANKKFVVSGGVGYGVNETGLTPSVGVHVGYKFFGF